MADDTGLTHETVHVSLGSSVDGVRRVFEARLSTLSAEHDWFPDRGETVTPDDLRGTTEGSASKAGGFAAGRRPSEETRRKSEVTSSTAFGPWHPATG